MKKKLVVAILAVLVLTVGGLAAAAPWGYGAGRGPFQPPQLTEEQKQQAIQWGEKMLELKKMRLDWAVQEGRLTQEQADQLMKFARERYEWQVKNDIVYPGGIFGHKQFFRFHGGKAPDGGPGPWGNVSAEPKE